MQYIANLNKNILGAYKNKLITEEVILTDERLYQHILIYHNVEYKQFKPYLKDIIEKPDFIIEDNRHEATMIFLKQMCHPHTLVVKRDAGFGTPAKRLIQKIALVFTKAIFKYILVYNLSKKIYTNIEIKKRRIAVYE